MARSTSASIKALFALPDGVTFDPSRDAVAVTLSTAKGIVFSASAAASELDVNSSGRARATVSPIVPAGGKVRMIVGTSKAGPLDQGLGIESCAARRRGQVAPHRSDRRHGPLAEHHLPLQGRLAPHLSVGPRGFRAARLFLTQSGGASGSGHRSPGMTDRRTEESRSPARSRSPGCRMSCGAGEAAVIEVVRPGRFREGERTTMMRGWTVRDSLELYNVASWGAGFFTVNGSGHVEVRPRGPRGRASTCSI